MKSQQQNSGTSAIKVSQGHLSFKLARGLIVIRELSRPQVEHATIRTKKFQGKQVDPQQSVYEVKEGRPETRRKSVDFKTYSKRDWGTRNEGRLGKCVHGNVRRSETVRTAALRFARMSQLSQIY